MFNWRDIIINKFKNQNSSFIFVIDHDSLLNEEQVLRDIIVQGYEVLRYEDSISFRYLYEQKYRDKDYKLLVFANEDIYFPYEFSSKALKIKIDIQTIYPKFSAKAIRAMEREDFDELDHLHHRYRGLSSEYETLDYILRNLYKVPYDIIDSEVGLYKALLSLHYQEREIPDRMKKFLCKEWHKVLAFREIPLKKIIYSSTVFYRYLEEKWKAFVKDVLNHKEGQINDSSAVEYSNPLANGDVRRMMSDLFLEGTLERVTGVDTTYLPEWMRIGVTDTDSAEELRRQMNHLYEKITTRLPNTKRYKDWLIIIEYISQLKHVATKLNQNVDDLIQRVNQSFQEWMLHHYHSLTSLPPYPLPKLVHHVPHVMNKQKQVNEKVALLVMDGMSYPQWIIVRDYLQKKGFNFEENGIFAWVPTLTSVSRQAIFSGNIPFTFARTIMTTSSEEKWWKAFWEEHGVLKQYVTYQKALGKEPYDSNQIKGLARKSTKVFGAVIDVIDQFSHHAVLGEKSVLSNLELWLESNYLVQLLTDLKDNEFTIYLTSDHGNSKATGIGRVSEGVLVDQKGERVRVYSDSTLYKDAAANLSAKKWSNIGLPEDYYVLLADKGEAFVPKGREVITHGGISIEEVIVPFIKVID